MDRLQVLLNEKYLLLKQLEAVEEYIQEEQGKSKYKFKEDWKGDDEDLRQVYIFVQNKNRESELMLNGLMPTDFLFNKEQFLELIKRKER